MIRPIIGLMGLSLLTACASSAPVLAPPSSGAVAANISAQAITPDASQKANRHIPQDRALRAAALERYRTDKVKVPTPTQTGE